MKNSILKEIAVRLGRFASAVAVFFLAACNGGSSPTAPPTPVQPVEIEGSWSGSVTLTSPSATTCILTFQALRLEPQAQDYSLDWQARCPDGTEGSGFGAISELFGNQVLIIGIIGRSVFGGCGWASFANRESNRMEGDFETPENCQTGPVLRGRLAMTKLD